MLAAAILTVTFLRSVLVSALRLVATLIAQAFPPCLAIAFLTAGIPGATGFPVLTNLVASLITLTVLITLTAILILLVSAGVFHKSKI
jgi:hypothetical protein